MFVGYLNKFPGQKPTHYIKDFKLYVFKDRNALTGELLNLYVSVESSHIIYCALHSVSDPYQAGSGVEPHHWSS